jgi:hypothetical protein
MALHAKIIRLLRRELPDFDHALEKLPGGRVSGVVISSAFDSMDHRKRQDKLWGILKRDLTAEELAAVGAIAALTPAEASVKAS